MADIAHAVREALRKPASRPCACFATELSGRNCNGVCEDAVDRVSAAVQSLLYAAREEGLEDAAQVCRYMLKHQNFPSSDERQSDYQRGFSDACELCNTAVLEKAAAIRSLKPGD